MLVCSRISSSCILKRKQMTLVISMLNNIFRPPLDTESKKLSSQVSQCTNVKCHNVQNYVHLKKTTQVARQYHIIGNYYMHPSTITCSSGETTSVQNAIDPNHNVMHDSQEPQKLVDLRFPKITHKSLARGF